MSKIRLHGSSSGYTEIAPVAASGNNTLTLPNDGTIISQDSNGAVGVTSITVGTGVTIGDGRVTCSTLHGSAANCTQIPAANIVGIATAGFSGGITEFDMWYLTTNKSDNSDMTANFLRNDRAGAAAQIGNGMSESSGIFTFPTTGKYLIITTAEFSINGSDNCILDTLVTTNNSSYTIHTRCVDGNNGSGERSGKATSYAFKDVTDTSQVKVKFATLSFDSGSYLVGSTTIARTSFLFIRLGPT